MAAIFAESNKLGWDRYFEGYLVGATDAPRDKPATDPIFMALEGPVLSLTGMSGHRRYVC